MTVRVEKILCKFCPKIVTRFYADSTPRNDSPFFLMQSHYKEEHPAEYQRITHYLNEEVIVQEGE